MNINILLRFFFVTIIIVIRFSSEILSQVNCCCGGVAKELNFPGLDFEFAPEPAPAWWITYTSGSSFGPWQVNKGGIDHVDKDYLNTGSGNPNGSSNFVDLYGSTPPGAGGITYTLTGLTANYHYTLQFYYARFDAGGSFKANILVENGAWLNANLTATNLGNVIWLKASYEFVAKNSSTTLQFNDAGSSGCICGVLIDDIKIYECPEELPIINDPPIDLEVECDNQVPPPQKLNITDNCDPNPIVTFTEKKVVVDSCTKKITRNWEIKDKCGNLVKEDQIIDVIDNSSPQFTKLPEDITISCNQDVTSEFNKWISNHGNAIAKDACGTIKWRATYDHQPINNCEVVYVQFESIDHCGNISKEYASFNVIDTVPPRFINKAEDKNYFCILNPRDSLKNWLATFGYSKTDSDCGITILSSNFNGDSTKNPLIVTFYSEDNCGNVDSCIASFFNKIGSDTIRITEYSCNFTQNSLDTFLKMVNGCDSITIVEKIIRPSDSTYIQTNTCDPLHKSFDTIPLVNAFGCDSLIFNEYILRPIPITNLQKSDCSFSQYSKDTVNYLGQYCDSLVIIEKFPLRKDSNSVVINTCDQSKADTTILNLTNSLGCDSIVTVYTLFIPQQMTFLIDKVCGLKKMYTDTAKFILGFCDSLVITTHTPLLLDTSYIQSSTCDQSKTGTFSKLLTNQSGCDSLVIEDIILNKSDSIYISISTCIKSESGIKVLPLMNRFGCDSTVITTTTFIPWDTSRITQTTCDPFDARTEINVYHTSECDSVVFLTVILIRSDTTRINHTTCDLANSGSDTIYLGNTGGCDSIVIINTQLLSSDTTQLNTSSCNPTDAGLSTLKLQNSKGCDSLILIFTNYVPLRLKFDFDSITCFNANDGVFRILNTSDFSNSFDLIVNNVELGTQNQIGNLSPGSYEIFIRDKNGCVTDSILFNLLNPADLIIDLGDNITVKKGTRINLDLLANRTLQNIFWSPSILTNCINCPQINFVADQDTWIFTQAIDDRGCSQNDSIFIRVKKDASVFAPNSFSPNEDKINDYFFIQGDASSFVLELFIFDRWGNLLFDARNNEVNNPQFGWNGTFKSQKMNPGVYVFYAKILTNEQEIIILKGDLTLLR